MKLSRLFIAVAAAFSASAFAVAPPGAQGPRQDDSPQASQSSTVAGSTREREENARPGSSPDDPSQSSAPSESQIQEPERTAMYGEPPLPSGAHASPAPQPVPERMPPLGEQS